MNKRMWSRVLAMALAVVTAFSTPVQTVRAAGPDSGAAVLTAAESADVQSPEAEEEVPPDEVFAEEGSAESVVTAEIPAESDAAAGEEDELVVTAETPAEPDAAVDEEAEAGILGAMPDDFVLSAEEEQIKRDMAAEDVTAQLADLVPGEDYVDGEVICLANSRAEAEAIAEAYHGTLSEYAYGVAVISLAGSGLTVAEAVAAGADPDLNVPAVEPDYINTVPDEEPALQVIAGDAPTRDGVGEDVHTRGNWWTVAPSDPYLNPANSKNYQWFHEMIDTYPAWQVTKGEGVTVAVIDAGVQYTHEEFGYVEGVSNGRVTVDALWPAKQILNSKYGDNKPYYTPADDNSKDEDGRLITNSNGTHVAGIIAASLDNGEGGSGIAPEADILAIPVPHSSAREFSSRHLIQAVLYVAGYDQNEEDDVVYDPENANDRRADILTISLYEREYSALLNAAVERAYDRGVTVCAPMGDDQANDRVYPASLDHVIAVAGVNAAGDKTASSSYGAWADIAAPAENIYSTVSTHLYADGYQSKSGTAQASAMVAGACALYMGAVGHVHPDVMERVLKAAVTKTTAKDIGAGILNVGRMFDNESLTAVIEVRKNDPTQATCAIAQGGESITAAQNVPCDAKVYLYCNDYLGNDEDAYVYTGDESLSDIVYTSDGKTPAVKDGQVTVGERYTGELSILHDIIGEESDIYYEWDTSKWKKSYTVKAICISAMGTVGKVTTLTIRPVLDGVRLANNVYIDNTPVNGFRIIAGSSFTFTGCTGYPDGTSDHKVKWRIRGYRDGDLSKATISAAGVLKTDPNQTGTLIVEVSSPDGRATNTADVYVVKRALTGTIKLDTSKVTLYRGTPEDPRPKTAVVTVTELKDNTKEKNSLFYPADDGHENPYLPDDLILWTSSNEDVATVVSEDGEDMTVARITAQGKGNATITAQALDGSGKKATVNVTVVQDVEEIRITGPSYIKPGGKATYKAEVLPASAATKTVTWEIYDKSGNKISDPNKITVSATGQVTVTGKGITPPEEFSVHATAKDGSNCTGSKSFFVQPEIDCAKDVVITAKTALDEILKPVTGTRRLANSTDAPVTTLSSAQLMGGASIGRELVLTPIAIYDLGGGKEKAGNFLDDPIWDPVWTVGNPDLVYLYSAGDSAHSVTLTPRMGAKGTTTVTCALADGSKKATLSVKVLLGVTKVRIKNAPEYLLQGGKGSMQTTLEPATADYKKLTWQVLYKDSIPTEDVTVSETGRISVSPTAKPGYYSLSVAEDPSFGWGLTVLKKPSEILFTPTPAMSPSDLNKYHVTIKQMELPDEDDPVDYMAPGEMTLYSGETYCNRNIKAIILSGSREDGAILDPSKSETVNPKWTTSNAKLVEVQDHGSWASIAAVSGAKGTATITCAAQDGSGVKATLKVNVISPVEEIHVSGPAYLAPGDKVTLKKEVLPATAGNKNVTWRLYDTKDYKYVDEKAYKDELQINNNGQISLVKDPKGDWSGHVIEVRATAADGCGGYDESYSFTVRTAPVSSVVIEQISSYISIDDFKKSPYRPVIQTKELKKNPGVSVAPLSSVQLWYSDPYYKELKIYGQCLETDPDGKESKISGCYGLVSWSSSNEGLVRVTGYSSGSADLELGPDVAYGKTGTATITCKVNDNSGKKATLTVRVGKPVESIVIDNAPQYLPVGATFTPKTRVLPADAADKGIEWMVISEEEGNIRIKDPDVVSVTPTGQVKVGNKAVIGRRYRVDAYAKDMNICKGYYYFTATKDKISSIVVAVPSGNEDTVKKKNNGKITERKIKGTSTTLSSLTSCTVLNTAEDKDPSRVQVEVWDLAANASEEWKVGGELSYSSSNNAIATVTSKGSGKYEIKGVPDAKGTATITFAALDGSGKKASVSVKVAQPVTGITITGPDYIARGYSGTFKTTVVPANADNKKVEWYDVTDEDNVLAEGITVSPSGVVSVSKDAEPGTYKVRAHSTDGSNLYPSYPFTVLSARATTLGITYDWTNSATDGLFESYFKKHQLVPDTRTGSLTSLQLFPWNLEAEDDDGVAEQSIYLKPLIRDDKGNPIDDLPVEWSVSNDNLLYMSEVGDNKVLIESMGVGTATVTCALLDGSGKKASTKVNIIRPVSDLQLVPAAGSPDRKNGFLAFGKSATLKAVPGELYGKPSNSKVEWGWTLTMAGKEEIDSAFNVKFPTADWQTNPKAKNYATITNGKLTIPANSKIKEWLTEYPTYSPTITVYARTLDGSCQVATYSYSIRPATTKLVCMSGATAIPAKITVYKEDLGSPDYSARKEYDVWRYYKDQSNNEQRDERESIGIKWNMLSSLEVTSSDPEVVSAYYTAGASTPKLVLIQGDKVGTATVTLTAADGSGVKTSFKVEQKAKH